MSNRQQKCLIRKRKTRATIAEWKGFSLRKPPKGNRRPTNCRRHAKTPLETFCIFSSVAFGTQNQRPPTSHQFFPPPKLPACLGILKRKTHSTEMRAKVSVSAYHIPAIASGTDYEENQREWNSKWK